MAPVSNEDAVLAQLLLWVLVGEIVLSVPLVVAIVATVQRHYERWLVFRSRGLWYTRCLSIGPFVQFALSLSLALAGLYTPWAPQAVGLAVLGTFEELWLILLTGVVIGRQVVLSIVFRTLPVATPRTVVPTPLATSPHHFLLVPLGVVLLWALLSILPQLLALYGAMPPDGAAILTYITAAVVVALYAVPALCNRTIPMPLFCDYRANLITFAALVVVSVGLSVLNGVFLVPAGLLLSQRLARACAYVGLAAMYTTVNLVMPAGAVWRNDLEYLQLREDALREVRFFVPHNEGVNIGKTVEAGGGGGDGWVAGGKRGSVTALTSAASPAPSTVPTSGSLNAKSSAAATAVASATGGPKQYGSSGRRPPATEAIVMERITVVLTSADGSSTSLVPHATTTPPGAGNRSPRQTVELATSTTLPETYA
jgi:hypothetical protein